ncbi:MAG TPA: hypothetical protein VGJ60_07085 [Chloroflexota bacterium]|jgi:hypothetical protein
MPTPRIHAAPFIWTEGSYSVGTDVDVLTGIVFRAVKAPSRRRAKTQAWRKTQAARFERRQERALIAEHIEAEAPVYDRQFARYAREYRLARAEEEELDLLYGSEAERRLEDLRYEAQLAAWRAGVADKRERLGALRQQIAQLVEEADELEASIDYQVGGVCAICGDPRC